VTPTLIATLQVGHAACRLIRFTNHHGDEDLLIEQARADGLGDVAWVEVSREVDQLAVLKAHSLSVPVPAAAPQCPQAEALHTLADWVDRHGVAVSAAHFWVIEGLRVQVEDADFDRLAALPGAVVTRSPWLADADRVREDLTLDGVTAWRVGVAS
jgi:hypothetical protein